MLACVRRGPTSLNTGEAVCRSTTHTSLVGAAKLLSLLKLLIVKSTYKYNSHSSHLDLYQPHTFLVPSYIRSYSLTLYWPFIWLLVEYFVMFSLQQLNCNIYHTYTCVHLTITTDVLVIECAESHADLSCV